MDKSIKRYLAEIGSRGGKTSSANMTKAQLKERGRKAIAARWAKQGDDRKGKE